MQHLLHIVFALLAGVTTGHLFTKSTFVDAKTPQASKNQAAPVQTAPAAAEVTGSQEQPK